MMYDRVDAPKLKVVSMESGVGVLASNRILPIKVP